MSNIIFSVIKALMGILFPLISYPYAARILGATSLGTVQYCNSIISYFSLFAGLGISIYATRQGVKYRDNADELSKFTKEVLLINVTTTIIAYVALVIISFNTGLKSYGALLGVCSLNIIFTTFGIDWLYQILENFAYISIRACIFQGISLILLFAFVKKPDDFLIYALINVISTGGSFILNIWNSRKYIKWRKHYHLEIKRHLRPIMIIFGISASASIYLNLDQVMVGALRNNFEVGLYSAAVKLITVIKTLLSAVSTALLPRLSFYKSSDDSDAYGSLLSKSINLIMLLVIPASIGIIMLRDEILLIFAGLEYVDATMACAILAFNMIFSVIDGMFYNQIFLPMKMESKACIATAAGAVCNFVLNWLIIPQYGFTGAAFTTLISEIVVFLILLLFMRTKISLKKVFKYTPQYFEPNSAAAE